MSGLSWLFLKLSILSHIWLMGADMDRITPSGEIKNVKDLPNQSIEVVNAAVFKSTLL